ncbi:MAG TPA: RES family NAD+ phosphorylase [Brevundimonas sp.]
MNDQANNPVECQPLLCSECFQDAGLRLDAERFGLSSRQPCPNCGSLTGALLDLGRIRWVAHRFFVLGSLTKVDYGGAPRIEFNDLRSNEISFEGGLQQDVDLICEKAEVGFFHYGPPLWRLGHIEPLEALQDGERAASVIQRILAEYPVFSLQPGDPFFRLRKDVSRPSEKSQFDSPPNPMCGTGRLDSEDIPVLYGSSDLQLCVHECRVTVDDSLHVATLEATKPLRLLDLTAILQEDCTTFESLDMTVHLLFLAGPHSYPISRVIGAAAKEAGFDGLLFPSYFSLLRTGAPFLETAYGLATRAFPDAASREAGKIVPNIALFGRPIADGRIDVRCINRLYLRQAAYDLGFGPADI